eukprot:338321_1
MSSSPSHRSHTTHTLPQIRKRRNRQFNHTKQTVLCTCTCWRIYACGVIVCIVFLTVYTWTIYKSQAQDPYSDLVLMGISTDNDPDIMHLIHGNITDGIHHKQNKNVIRIGNLSKPMSNQQRLAQHRQSLLHSIANQMNTKHPPLDAPINEGETHVPLRSVGYKINHQISDELRMTYKNKFSSYLRILCNNSATLPTDCNALMLKMLNISIHHSFSLLEVNALAQRIEYLPNIIPQKMPYLFIHVPKSAGTSLSHALESQFKRNFHHYWAPNQVKQAKLQHIQTKSTQSIIFGHLPYGVHKVFIANRMRTHTLWTMEQWMNHTKYNNNTNGMKIWMNKATKTDENHQWTKHRNLEEWVGFMEDSKDCSVAHIAGVHSKAWWNAFSWWKDHTKSLQLLPKRSAKQAPLKEWIVTREHYNIARWNLINMGWVGIFDRLSESVQQLEYFWNIKQTTLTTRNKNRHKPLNPLTPQETRKILEFNPGDTWLYELAVVLFEQQQLVLKYAIR